MIIHRLKLQHFKRFRNYEILLEPGLNVIKGSNEAGKSTLLEALISSFFYDTSAKVDAYRTWRNNEKPKLELEFSVSGQKLSLKKDYQESAVSLGYIDGSKHENSSKKIKSLLAGYLGFDTDKAFLATSCVRQHELDMVASEKTPFRLENILLGGSDSVDVSALIKQLDTAITELKRKGARNPGLLVTLPQDIQKLEEPLKRAVVLGAERTKINKELVQLKEEYKPKSILLDRAKQHREWMKENESLTNDFNNIHRKITELKSLQEKLNQCEKQIAQNPHFKTQEKAEQLKWAFKYSLKSRWYYWFIVILTLGIAHIIVKLRVRKMLKEVNCSSEREFYRIYDEYDELHRERERLKAKLEDTFLDKLEDQKTDISRKLAVKEAQLTDDMKTTDLTAEQLIKLEKETDELTTKIQNLTNLYKEYGTRIQEITRGKGEQAELEEKLDNLKEELARTKTRFHVLSLTKHTMEKARRMVLESSIDSFNKHIAGYLSLFTKGKYTRIKTEIIENGIRFLIYSPEKNEWTVPAELSSGTQDQVYLAARLTLLKLVAGECRPPLIMDDPFTSFDIDRLSSAMQICKETAGEYQILLFTCTDQYDTYADNIIELDYEPQRIPTSPDISPV